MGKKFAYVVTKWIGTGTNDDPQRPEVASEVGYCEDVTGQFVKLSDKAPDPNLVVVRVGELRSPKHDGMVDKLKTDGRFLVLEEWEVDDDGVVTHNVPHAKDKDVKKFLKDRGVKDKKADLVKGNLRTAQMRIIAKTFEKKG